MAENRKPVFVVQKHRATRLHYDFRLEKDGALKSWAVPKEPAAEPGVRRLAVQVEDHELGYEAFEGTIPEGEYGAGTVEIWDSGHYAPVRWTESEIVVELHGKKLQGVFCLVRLKADRTGDRNWLFFRKKTR